MRNNCSPLTMVALRRTQLHPNDIELIPRGLFPVTTQNSEQVNDQVYEEYKLLYHLKMIRLEKERQNINKYGISRHEFELIDSPPEIKPFVRIRAIPQYQSLHGKSFKTEVRRKYSPTKPESPFQANRIDMNQIGQLKSQLTDLQKEFQERVVAVVTEAQINENRRRELLKMAKDPAQLELKFQEERRDTRLSAENSISQLERDIGAIQLTINRRTLKHQLLESQQ